MLNASRAITRALALALLLVSPVEAAQQRDARVRQAFVREQPCPARRENRCQYQVDHVQALVCGGRDVRSNLAWLNVETHKIKSRDDVRRCRGTVYGFMMRAWRLVRYWE